VVDATNASYCIVTITSSYVTLVYDAVTVSGSTSYYVITITSINKVEVFQTNANTDYISGTSASYCIVTITSSNSGGKLKAYPPKSSPSNYIIAISSINCGIGVCNSPTSRALDNTSDYVVTITSINSACFILNAKTRADRSPRSPSDYIVTIASINSGLYTVNAKTRKGVSI